MYTKFRKAWFMWIELCLHWVIHPVLRARLLHLCGATIGKNVRIYEVTFINLEKGFKNLIIEDDVHIGTHCLLDLEGRIFLKKGVTLSPQVTILTHSDAGSQHHSPLCECFKPVIADVTIETYCWIGCRVTLLAGSHVRQKTVVGACSLVKGALDSCALYAGIPARKVRTLPFENF